MPTSALSPDANFQKPIRMQFWNPTVVRCIMLRHLDFFLWSKTFFEVLKYFLFSLGELLTHRVIRKKISVEPEKSIIEVISLDCLLFWSREDSLP